MSFESTYLNWKKLQLRNCLKWFHNLRNGVEKAELKTLLKENPYQTQKEFEHTLGVQLRIIKTVGNGSLIWKKYYIEKNITHFQETVDIL